MVPEVLSLAHSTQEKSMNSRNTLIESQEHTLILYPARLKMLLGLAGTLACVAVGAWMVSLAEVWFISIGIMCISFFGLCGLICLVGLIRPFRILVVNEEGIQQQSLLRNVFVAWKEIDAIISFEGSIASLNVYLSDSGRETFAARYPRLGRVSRLFGGLPLPAISLSELMLPFPVQQVSGILQTRYQRQIEQYQINVR